MSLTQLPVEILLLIEARAKDRMYRGDSLIETPSLILSWVSQYLRAVFMPRFWSYCVVDTTKFLSQTEALIRDSPPDTYRHLVKYFRFGGFVQSTSPIDTDYYEELPPPGPEDSTFHPANALHLVTSGDPAFQGPREPWPAPFRLLFDDPKRLFKLARRRLNPKGVFESSDEAHSEVDAEEERVIANDCKLYHPALHTVYRHRVKPDDYWLPGAVHSVGPLKWDRRNWCGGFSGPDYPHSEETWLPTTTEFLSSMVFVLSQLNLEAFCWTAGFALPPELCECLLHHATFQRLSIRPSWRGAGYDCFSAVQGCDEWLIPLAPKLTVLDDKAGTALGEQIAEPGEDEYEDEEDSDPLVIAPLSVYPERNSAAGLMRFLLAAKKLKHLSSASKGVFHTPGLLGVFARLHSLHWGDSIALEVVQHREHVLAVSKLRSCLWQLAQALDRPDHLLEASDVQRLSESTGEYAEIGLPLAPLAKRLAQVKYAALVAQGWNEQEQRGPNERPIFPSPIISPGKVVLSKYRLSGAYENPFYTESVWE